MKKLKLAIIIILASVVFVSAIIGVFFTPSANAVTTQIFGYQADGGTSRSIQNTIYGSQYQVTSGGLPTSIAAYLAVSSTGTTDLGYTGTTPTSYYNIWDTIRGARLSPATSGLVTSLKAYLTWTPFGVNQQNNPSLSIVGTIRGLSFTCMESGIITSLKAYIDCGTTNTNMKAAIYYDGTGNMLAETQEYLVTQGTTGWFTFNFATPQTVSAGTAYDLVVWAKSGQGTANLYRYSTGLGAGVYKSIAYGVWPNPAGFTTSSDRYCVYATFANDGNPRKVQAAIYTDAGALLASAPQQLVSTAGQYTFTFASQPLVIAGQYYVFAVWGGDDSGPIQLGANGAASGKSASATYGSSFPGSVTFSSDSNQYCLYVTYTWAARVNAAIYSSTGSLVCAATEQGVTASGLYTFTIPNPQPLTTNAYYILVAWGGTGPGPGGTVYIRASTSGGTEKDKGSQTYGSFPSSVTFASSNVNDKCSIYVTVQTAYTITVTQTANGNINPGTGSVNYGATPSYTITPNTGYHIASITANGGPVTVTTPSGQTYQFSAVSADGSLTATYVINTYTLTVTQGAHGTISPGTTVVDYLGGQTFSIGAATGYHIVDVVVDSVSQGAITSYPFTNVQANHTITATYAINTYTLTVTQTDHGTISPGTTVVDYLGGQTFSIGAATGYHIVDVVVDSVSQGAITSYPFTNVQANHTITATYAINTYTLTVTQTDHGTIDPGTTVVNYGDTPSFSITPDTGYHIASITANGGPVTVTSPSGQTYQFGAVSADGSLTANFEASVLGTSISVGVDPDIVDKAGAQTTTISGRLTSGGLGVLGKSVRLFYQAGATDFTGTPSDGTWTELPYVSAPTTEADGNYSYAWDPPVSLSNGYYWIKAWFEGDTGYTASSNTTGVDVVHNLLVVPVMPLGALMAVFSMVGALGGYVGLRRYRFTVKERRSKHS